MASKTIKAGEGRVWIQPNGPGTPFQFLTCYGAGDITIPSGDVTPVYCASSKFPNVFDVIDTIKATGGLITFSMEAVMQTVTNYLLSMRCPTNLDLRYTKCGRPDIPTGWEFIISLRNADPTGKTISAPVARNPDGQGEVLTSADLSATSIEFLTQLDFSEETVSEAKNLNDVTFCDNEQCASDCGAYSPGCETGYAVADATAYTNTANVLKTINGLTWIATLTDPFAMGEDIVGVACLGTRVVVLNGTHSPPQIAYTDDGGATWTTVDLALVGAWYPNGIYWLDGSHLWLACDLGYVAFSDDMGAGWTVQDAGVATAQNLAAIFVNSDLIGYAVGAANAMVKTTNGAAWAALTGPEVATALTCVWMTPDNRVFVGTAAGNLWYSKDGGATWVQSEFTGDGAGTVKDIQFYDDNIGYLVHETAGGLGRVLRTIDGGATWQLEVIPTNSGLNAVWVCGPNLLHVVGDAHSGVAEIIKGETQK